MKCTVHSQECRTKYRNVPNNKNHVYMKLYKPKTKKLTYTFTASVNMSSCSNLEVKLNETAET